MVGRERWKAGARWAQGHEARELCLMPELTGCRPWAKEGRKKGRGRGGRGSERPAAFAPPAARGRGCFVRGGEGLEHLEHARRFLTARSPSRRAVV